MDFGFTEEQLMFKDQVIRFAKKELVPRAQEHDLKGEFDFQSFRKLGDLGILGLHFPEELGGSDADVVTSVLAGEALGEAGVDGGLTLSYGAHTFLCVDTIFAHGTEDQQKKYVPKLASGEWIGCMGLTEPGAGSDVASITTRAEKSGNGYILNGNKMFITNGPIADVAVVYAKTGKDLKHAGISAFIVEKGTPGYSAGKHLIKMGVRSSPTSELIFEDCEIPAENLIGQEGAGFQMALRTVEWDRSTILAPFVGGMSYVLKKCVRYAKQRHQFGRPSNTNWQTSRSSLRRPGLCATALPGARTREGRSTTWRRPLPSSLWETGVWGRPMTRWFYTAAMVTVTNMRWKSISGIAGWRPLEGEPLRSKKGSYRNFYDSSELQVRIDNGHHD
jgi:alkylation response protein AidB-like acyl-CoA dehydrogenase